QRIMPPGGGHDQAVHAPADHVLQDHALALLVVVGVGEDGRVARRPERVLDAADDGREDRVGDVGDEHADDPRAVGLQPVGDGIGTGRMGFSMAARLLKKGAQVTVWNRTRAKAEPLAPLGARLADSPAALADRDIVFTMVAGSDDLLEVVSGPQGLLSRGGRAPKILIDCSTVSQEASAQARGAAAVARCAMLAAPVSGNAKVVKAGRLSRVVSGSKDAYDEALPYLESLGEGVSYVGEGELSRIVKICHNV